MVDNSFDRFIAIDRGDIIVKYWPKRNWFEIVDSEYPDEELNISRFQAQFIVSALTDLMKEADESTNTNKLNQ